MEDQYTISDLRQLISRAAATATAGPAQFPAYPPAELFSSHSPRPAHHHHHHPQYEMLMMGHHNHEPNPRSGLDHQFNSDSTTAVTNNSGGFDCGSSRWPRQETLILLEVRSKLDHKFKEANQKGPLWDQVARIMSEEHGYQRSGKKCREKFENLYKYYKKTKEGKAGRQDGKHYRFFRQLEALYGDHSSSSHHHHHHHDHDHDHPMGSASDTHITGNAPHLHQNPISPHPNNTSTASLSNSSDFDTSSWDCDDGSMESNGSKEMRDKTPNNNDSMKNKKKRRNWKAKIKEFIDHQMSKVMERQEAWLEKMMNTLEERENERMQREELWRKQDDARIDKEHKFWANERAWIEARDLALMKALEKLTNNHGGHHQQWAEPEITRLVQLRTSMESRFEQCGFSEEVLWEDIAAKMAYFGYERSAIVCKEKWDSINKTLQEKGNLNHTRKNKEKSNYGVISSSLNGGGGGGEGGGGLYINNQVNNGNNCDPNPIRLQLNDGSSSSPSSHNSNINVNGNSTNVMNDSCLRFFLGDGDNLGWESNYGLKAHQG